MLPIGLKRTRELRGTLHELSAWELLQAHREATELTPSDRGLGICFNACVLSRALRRGRKRVFSSGEAVLLALTEEQIERLCRSYLERFVRAQRDTVEAVNPTFDEARFEELKRR